MTKHCFPPFFSRRFSLFLLKQFMSSSIYLKVEVVFHLPKKLRSSSNLVSTLTLQAYMVSIHCEMLENKLSRLGGVGLVAGLMEIKAKLDVKPELSLAKEAVDFGIVDITKITKFERVVAKFSPRPSLTKLNGKMF